MKTITSSPWSAAGIGLVQGIILWAGILMLSALNGSLPAISLMGAGYVIFGGIGTILCVALCPTTITWDQRTLTIRRAWGTTHTYQWAELHGLSSFGKHFGACSLRFQGSPLIYIGSYGFSHRDWKAFQTEIRTDFREKTSSAPWI